MVFYLNLFLPQTKKYFWRCHAEKQNNMITNLVDVTLRNKLTALQTKEDNKVPGQILCDVKVNNTVQ